MTATVDLARLAASLTLDRIPEAAREAAKAALLDVLACALAAREERVVRLSRDWVAGEGGVPACTIWGTPHRGTPSRAAFANGVAAHALDYDDVNWAMNGHPSTVLGPAALSAVESRRGNGSQFLLAYVVGLEIAGRIGEMAGHAHYDVGWHPTATIGVFGATAAVWKAWTADVPVLETALGIAASTASGSRMNFGTDTKPLHAGFAAERGVMTAELALGGATARHDGLETRMGFFDLYGCEPGGVARTAIEPLVLTNPGIELKPYPSCRFTHRIIDAVLAIRNRHPRGEPVSIECTVDPFSQKILIYPTPENGLQAKFSMPYCAAVAWIDGSASLDSFRDERVRREDVQSLAARVRIQDGQGDREAVRIVFRDGRTESESVVLPLGHPQRPMTDDQRFDKVRSCVEPLLGTSGAQQLIDVMHSLETLEDITVLSRLLACSGSGRPQLPAG